MQFLIKPHLSFLRILERILEREVQQKVRYYTATLAVAVAGIIGLEVSGEVIFSVVGLVGVVGFFAVFCWVPKSQRS